MAGGAECDAPEVDPRGFYSGLNLFRAASLTPSRHEILGIHQPGNNMSFFRADKTPRGYTIAASDAFGLADSYIKGAPGVVGTRVIRWERAYGLCGREEQGGWMLHEWRGEWYAIGTRSTTPVLAARAR